MEHKKSLIENESSIYSTKYDEMLKKEREASSSNENSYAANAKSAKKGTKFNFSKPLCLIFSLILLFTMVMPWFKINASIALFGDTSFDLALEPSIFSLQPRFSEYAEMVNTYAPLVGVDMAPYSELIWMLNGILLMVTAYFMIIIIFFVLFGLIGLFTCGKARYFFARVGGTMYIIGLFAVIVIGIIGGTYLSDMMQTIDPSYGISASFKITIWPIIAFVAALSFRTFGVKVLRRLNAMSCMNRGKTQIAKRELSILHDNSMSEHI